MSLRSKILLLFVVFALGPLLAVGIQASLQSLYLVEAAAESRVDAAGERAARGVAALHSEFESALEELALAYEERAAGAPAREAAGSAAPDGAAQRRNPLGPVAQGSAAPDAERVAALGAEVERFAMLEVVDASGAAVEVLKAEPVVSVCGEPAVVTLEAEIPDGLAGAARRLVGRVAAARLFGDGALTQGVGLSGYTFIVDQRTGRTVWDPACVAGTSGAAVLLDSLGAPVRPWTRAQESGRFAFQHGAMQRTAAFVNLASPPWTVVASTIIDEFTAPRRQDQLMWLLMVGFVALAAAGAFAVLITHQMRSLRELTDAAGRIGDGDFTPWLPPPGGDEVGRLSLAVGQMVGRLKLQMRQLERSRQFAVIGELASHLSHEIRNPLSSIKLNLQSLNREIRRGDVPADLPEVIELCLSEMQRLDGVVGNVLRLGRPNRGTAAPHQLHALLDGSLKVMRAQLEQRGIRVERRLDAELDTVRVDADQLSGALLNIYLNAIHAMPGGGTLRVWTELVTGADGEPIVRAHIADDGPGIEPEVRDRIFEPFFTTKASGSGIGLALAQQTIESHGGRIYLERRSELDSGAEFVIALPVLMEAERSSTPTPRPVPGEVLAVEWNMGAGEAAPAPNGRPAHAAADADADGERAGVRRALEPAGASSQPADQTADQTDGPDAASVRRE